MRILLLFVLKLVFSVAKIKMVDNIFFIRFETKNFLCKFIKQSTYFIGFTLTTIHWKFCAQDNDLPFETWSRDFNVIYEKKNAKKRIKIEFVSLLNSFIFKMFRLSLFNLFEFIWKLFSLSATKSYVVLNRHVCLDFKNWHWYCMCCAYGHTRKIHKRREKKIKLNWARIEFTMTKSKMMV